MKTTYTKLISAFLILAALSVTSCKKKPELPLKMKIENEILNCNYEKMVEDLRNHFDFKKLNYNGTFALEYAISDHNLEAIKMLFDHGVSPEIRLDWKDEENLSIIEYAHCEFKLRRMMCTSKEEYDQTAKEGKIFIDELEKLLKRYR